MNLCIRLTHSLSGYFMELKKLEISVLHEERNEEPVKVSGFV